MPQLAKVLTDEDLHRSSPTSRIDLAPYLAILAAVQEQGGVGGLVKLGEGETQRTEKRRLSTAAKEQGYQLTWRKSEPGQLRFVVARQGQRTPGARRKRQPVGA